jgi:hemoglobin
MLKDISTREDIRGLVEAFYDKVQHDELLAPFFSLIVPVDWETHLPIMVSFWENVLFHRGGYSGNPMEKHLHIHALSPFAPHHFERWLALFRSTVDERFSGARADVIKHRAESIAAVMQAKMQTG